MNLNTKGTVNRIGATAIKIRNGVLQEKVYSVAGILTQAAWVPESDMVHSYALISLLVYATSLPEALERASSSIEAYADTKGVGDYGLELYAVEFEGVINQAVSEITFERKGAEQMKSLRILEDDSTR